MTMDRSTVPTSRSPRVVVLNGISSAGKSAMARELQRRLDQPYLVFGVDTLVDAMPPAATRNGLLFASDGRVDASAAFTSMEDAWYSGLAAMARAGLFLILDEVFLGGGYSQRRLASALGGLDVRWVAVHCDLAVASSRERLRPDRTVGMAAAQFDLVHDDVDYDFHVDATNSSSADCAMQVISNLR